jgi:hypothetical protein
VTDEEDRGGRKEERRDRRAGRRGEGIKSHWCKWGSGHRTSYNNLASKFLRTCPTLIVGCKCKWQEEEERLTRVRKVKERE